MPGRYKPKAYKQRHKNQPLVINESNVTSIVEPGGMTRSGRVFAQRTVEPLAKAKGKEVASDTLVPAQNAKSQGGPLSPKVAASQKEADEF